MTIQSLELTNFRCYTRAALRPCPGITVLHGGNAQGKTALLEAVYLCCTGRSHRTPREKELIRWEQPGGRVTVCSQRLDGSHQVSIALHVAQRKEVWVGGKRIGRSGELLGHVTGVLFAPEDLRMVKDGPGERRRFLDMELSQVSPAYYYQLQRYARALAQRGKLLRECALRPDLAAALPDWDAQLAQAGARIIQARRDFVDKLGRQAAAIHRQISGGSEALTLSYQCSLKCQQEGQALENALYQALERGREADLRRCVTSVGPHRDDLGIALNGADARVYGSQGQQRCCALSLKLSELLVMKELTGEYPVLMLDDVMSELDPDRRRHLLQAMEGVQTIVTCTDPQDLAGASAGLMLRIDQGRILED